MILFRKRVAALAAALLLPLGLGMTAARGEGQPGVVPVRDTNLLEVPYLPQTEALCGGAAVAMVMQYWGERDIYAEEFAAYVSGAEEGITTATLARAAGRAGWLSIPFRASSRDVRHHLSRGRPLIALIQVAPDRYHYVVIIGRSNARVIYHDPAVAPARQVSAEDFDRLWRATGHWALLLLPEEEQDDDGYRETSGVGPATDAGPELVGVVAAPEPVSCRTMVERSVRLARGGTIEAAEELLLRAETVCPGSPAVARELGGLRFRQGSWSEASRLARRAVTLDPEDEYGWELLAASRHRAGDRAGALKAWNRLGGPTVDLIDVRGLRRTRYRVVTDRLGVVSRETLTSGKLERARRRLAALPTVRASAIRYRSHQDGSVTLDVAVVEHPPLPAGWADALGIVARSLPDREVVLPIASPLGAGARFEVRWRWWNDRPLVGGFAAAPGVLSLPGVFELSGYWERQGYSGEIVSSDGGPLVEERRHGSVELGDWISGNTRLWGGLGLDRWDEGPVRLSLQAGTELRLAAERLAIGLRTVGWPPVSGSTGFGIVGLGLAWRGPRDTAPIEWRARSGVELASGRSPLSLLAGAGTGQARDALLRAHPILDGGVIRADRIGRVLVHGSIEGTRWLWDWSLVSMGVALFGDAARLWKPLATGTEPSFMVDAGAGLRVALPWRGRFRADIALGLRDGATALSVAWEAPWPGRMP